ncbi:MAG: CgeB family protein [Gemmatimonadales bacterium]
MNDFSILVVAEFDDAHHAHAAQRCRALERLECRVEALDLRGRRKLLDRLGGGGKDLRTRLRKAIETARPEIVLVIGAPALDRQTVQELSAVTGLPWINWFPDDLRTIDDVLDRAPAYQQVFAAGSDVAARLATSLNRSIEVIPLAADPSIYRPLRSRDQYRANVVFAGTATPRREAMLAGLVEFGLALWGPGWRRTALKDYCRGEVPDTETYVRAYGGASVAINIHHMALEQGGAEPEAYLNQRVFEIAAIGVPQIVDRRGDLEHHFEPGRHLLAFDDAAELRELVRRALHDLPQAEQLGTAARREVLTRHTYMHRMKQLLGAVVAGQAVGVR